MQNFAATSDRLGMERLPSVTLRWFFLLLFLGTFGFAASAHSQNQEKPAWVDWENYMIMATGTGVPDIALPHLVPREYSFRKAKENAEKLLFNVIENLNLTSDMTVQETLAADGPLTSQVEETIKKARVVSIRYMSDLSVETDVELSLTGELAELLLPPDRDANPVPIDTLHCPLCGQPWTPELPFPKYLFSLPVFAGQEYTGLVVDCQGLGAQPALAPRIVTEQGEEIYGLGFLSRDTAVSQGVIRYFKDLQQAIEDSRVGETPLVVKASRATGPGKADLVIPNATAIILHHIENNLNFVRQGRVIVVLDKD